MNANHIELLQRLEQFQLDNPEASFPFSHKLARENGWTAHHARRVMAEYKRFAFLACAAGHPVSPSEDVDQAWHLHLTYSESYWDVFCPQILQRSLHHQPSRGGDSETEKFEEWYAKTLDSYRKFFGEDPPADIWPDPETRRATRHEFVRVDLERNWVVLRPKINVKSKFSRAVVLAAVVFCGTGAMLAQSVNVFDWRGPDFLVFYVVLYLVCLAAAIWLRRSLRTPGDDIGAMTAPALDGYSLAFLNGGPVLAVNTAIVSLASRKAISVDKSARSLTSLAPEPPFTHPLEKVVYQAAQGATGNSIANVRASVLGPISEMAQNLQREGLLVDVETARKAVLVPLLVALAPVAAGVVKIFIGISRDRPVTYLVLMCIASVFISLIACARRPRRSRKGDAVLNLLRSRYAEPRRFAAIRMGASPAELTVLMGLFGMNALAGTEFSSLRLALTPPANAGGGLGAGSCGSSCGGGGGWGGGGGGGCGGCGGH